MVDLYSYLSKSTVDDDYIKGVYLCTGSSSMEGLLDDVRNTQFPCLMVEVGDDGYLNVLDSCDDTRTLTFYVLDSNPIATAIDIRDILYDAKRKGLSLLKQMRLNGVDFGSEWFGVNFSRVNYFKVGPLGCGSYGYCFNLTIVEYGY